MNDYVVNLDFFLVLFSFIQTMLNFMPANNNLQTVPAPYVTNSMH